jgi:hypothetical protein
LAACLNVSEKHPDPELFKADRFVDENGKFIKADSVFTFSAGKM